VSPVKFGLTINFKTRRDRKRVEMLFAHLRGALVLFVIVIHLGLAVMCSWLAFWLWDRKYQVTPATGDAA